MQWAKSQGRTQDIARLEERLRDIGEIGSASAATVGGADARETHVARAIVDMGRLTQLAHRREGFFGEIAARICRELAVERCALFDTTSQVQVLAARGGDRAWLESLSKAMTSQVDHGVRFIEPLEGDAGPAGQLVLIPYRIDELNQRGWVCLENRRRPCFGRPR